jgi:mitochondrial-processing peptidase subunit alpha
MCSSSRESIMYQSSHFHQATPQALSLIADTANNPLFLASEVDAQREAARYEIREVHAKPEMIVPEILHHVAYNGETLGNPLLCPEERIDLITSDLIAQCRTNWYRPERMVIAGSGMPHQELVELADKHFSSIKFAPSPSVHSHMPNLRPTASQPQQQVPPHLLPTSQGSIYKSLTRAASYLYTSPTIAPSPDPLVSPPLNTHSKVTYTGGHRFIFDPSAEFNHVYLAFEGVGMNHDDIYALATIQVLLGGGGSFSAGNVVCQGASCSAVSNI